MQFWLWTVVCQVSLSLTIFQGFLKLMSIVLVMLSRYLLPLPSIFPSIRVFSNESALLIRWPKYWSFSFSISSVQFSCSVVSNSLGSHENCSMPGFPVHLQLLELSQTQVHWICDTPHPTISSFVVPFSFHLQSFPVSGSFLMSLFFASGGQSIRASASASVLPVNSQGWFSLGINGNYYITLTQFKIVRGVLFSWYFINWKWQYAAWEKCKLWSNCRFINITIVTVMLSGMRRKKLR